MLRLAGKASTRRRPVNSALGSVPTTRAITIMHPSGRIAALFFLVLSCTQAQSQDQPQKAIVAVVGDADRFNVGQDGFCGNRTEISSPSNARFRVPAGVRTYFFVKSSFRVAHGTYYCQGDYSFLPEPGRLHIIRYSMIDNQCRLELFKSDPGGTPAPMEVVAEEAKSCLVK